MSLFKRACHLHTNYTQQVMNGMGVDRHLLGLKACLQSGESHPLLTHPAMLSSTKFNLSTSSLSTGENYNGTGFGPGTEDGYGINYCIGKEEVKFGISTFTRSRVADSSRMAAGITSALRELQSWLVLVGSGESVGGGGRKSHKL